MANFFSDNKDLQFHLQHPMMRKIVELKERGFLSQASLDSALADQRASQANLASARAALSETRTRLAQSEIKARFPSELNVSVPKGYADKVKSEFVAEPRLIAPIEIGQKLGVVKVSVEDKPYGEYPVVAIEAVPVAGAFGRAIDSIRLWFN